MTLVAIVLVVVTVVTAGFYAMVPRVLDALRVPIEEDPTPTVPPS